MAIQPMALQVQNVQGNALGAFAQGQQQAQQSRANNLELARNTLENVGSLAFGVMGGRLDGQPDPALWEEALDMIGNQGVDVSMFRNRPDLAPVIAKASADTLGQLQLAQNERELQQRMAEFDLKVTEALKGTADQQNFAMAQKDPKFAAFLTAKDAPNPPSSVAEYNFYVEQEKAAGRQPMAMLEYEQAKKGQGFSVTTADGTTVQMGGGKLTEAQSKDTVYATRASGALPLVDKYGNELLNPVARGVEGDPTGLARGALQSPEFQQARQAGLEFLASILRKDTGAAVTASEEDMYGRIFLPVPGDQPPVLEQKRQARVRAVEAIKAGMPAQAILNMETALENAAGGSSPTPAPDEAPAAIPEGVPADVWEFLTPEERALWN